MSKFGMDDCNMEGQLVLWVHLGASVNLVLVPVQPGEP